MSSAWARKQVVQEWSVILGVYALLTILIWGLFGLDQGYWQDEMYVLSLIQRQDGFLAQLFTQVGTPTRILMAVPFTLAQWSGAPLLVIQCIYGASWFCTGILAHLLADRLFPGQLWLAYTAGSLTLTATSDFATNYIGMISILISIAFYFGAVICLLTWWRNNRRSWIWGTAICLTLCVWMYDAALPAILLTPGLLWALNDFQLNRRLIKATILWYAPIVPYLIFFVSFLIGQAGYAGVAFVSMTPEERFQRIILLFVDNFTPWVWALDRKLWFLAPEPLLANNLRLFLTLVGSIVFLGVSVWLWRRKPCTGAWSRREGYQLAIIGVACLVMALASNASYASVHFSEFFFRTQLVSRVWASLAVALAAYGLGRIAPRQAYLAFVLPAIFISFGIYGGLERQDYFLGYWRRHQAELRSIIDEVPGLQPDARILLYFPYDSVYSITDTHYRARAALSYLYADPSVSKRVFLWDNSCKAGTDGFTCGDTNSVTCFTADICEPETLPYNRLVVLIYSSDRNRFILQDHLPPGFLQGLVVPPGTYNPREEIIVRSLPGNTRTLLYSSGHVGSLFPGEPALIDRRP